MLLIVKYLVTAAIVVVVSEVARRMERWGALLGAIPIVSLMVIIWLQIETRDTAKIADYAKYTFWFVLPTLPMFLILPVLLNKGVNFWITLGISICITAAFFLLSAWGAKWFGVSLFG